LLATGLVDEAPGIGGLEARVHAGAIRFCPICDAYEATDRRVGVLGKLSEAGKKALFLRTYSRDVVLFPTDGSDDESFIAELRQAGVQLGGVPASVAEIEGRVEITTVEGACVRLDVLYPALGCEVRSDLGVALGASCGDNGTLMVDEHQRTSVPGLYAAGDVVADLHQLGVATGHAAIAATDIHNSLPRNLR
jgi:thioredoxin reductase (NADPH)